MQSELNRILAEQKALHLQACGLPPPAWAVEMRTQAFLEQAEIHRRARKGWVGALSCIPLAHPKIKQIPDPIHGQQMAQILSRNPRCAGLCVYSEKKSPHTTIESHKQVGAIPRPTMDMPIALTLTSLLECTNRMPPTHISQAVNRKSKVIKNSSNIPLHLSLGAGD